MRYPLLFLCFIFIAVSCKHDPLLPAADSFTIIAPAFMYTGDSVPVCDRPVAVSFSPDIGTLNEAGYYIAPSSLLHDSLRVTFTAQSGNHVRTASTTVLKSDRNDTVISFGHTIMPLLQANCNFSGCHGNGSKAGNVDLSDFTSVIRHVVPHKPAQSLLYLSLIKPDPSRRMPPAGALHAYRIAYVRKWIEQGALNH